MTFTYNDEGIRTSKTVNDVLHTEYILNGSQILAEITETYIIVYIYDAYGSPIGMQYKSLSSANSAWEIYWYEKNLQGDVIAVCDSTGTQKVKYIYGSAWGDHSTVYPNGGSNSAARYNPFRYRGYYYDSDLMLYYLQSRYYDPNTCRFISPDNVDVITATPMALTDKNLYAYCDNNPVMRVDGDGRFWETLFDVASLAFSVGDVIANPDDPWAWVGLAGDIVDLIPFVSGVGEATDLIRIATKVGDVADDVHDTAKAMDRAKDMVKASERAKSVRQAWKLEYENVINGGSGISRAWTRSEVNELLINGKVKGYQGHHMKSVKGYPELAGDPHNIQFLTRAEHLKAHGGNFRNITHGRFWIGD